MTEREPEPAPEMRQFRRTITPGDPTPLPLRDGTQNYPVTLLSESESGSGQVGWCSRCGFYPYRDANGHVCQGGAGLSLDHRTPDEDLWGV
jgi:hypothetical protein